MGHVGVQSVDQIQPLKDLLLFGNGNCEDFIDTNAIIDLAYFPFPTQVFSINATVLFSLSLSESCSNSLSVVVYING